MKTETKIAKEEREINLFAVALIYIVGGTMIGVPTLFMILEGKIIFEFCLSVFLGAFLCWITNYKVQESRK